ncbi:MAG: ABC transporter permease [Rhodocyclaceae bacterium]|nr:MAG: ABC transporter permease [Rhodocyclaceae bacterium]
MNEIAMDRTSPPFSVTLARVPGVAWILGLLLIGFTFFSRDFLTGANLHNIGLQSVILLILALPQTMIIMTEGCDIAVGAVLTLASVMLAWVLVHDGSLPLALAAALAVGLVFGLGNGMLVALLKMPPFVVTLGTMGVAQGLALIVTDGQSIVVNSDALQAVYGGNLGGVPIPLLIGVAMYALSHGLLYHTRFGTYVFALGGNAEALKLAGVRANAYLIAVYVLGGLMAGLAALILTARMSSGHPTSAIGMEFDAIAAVVVGGTSFEHGKGWLLGTLLGVVAVGVLRNGLNLLTIPSSAQVACIGLLVIVALFIDGLKGRK